MAFRMPQAWDAALNSLTVLGAELTLDDIVDLLGPEASKGNDGAGLTIELRVIPQGEV